MPSRMIRARAVSSRAGAWLRVRVRSMDASLTSFMCRGYLSRRSAGSPEPAIRLAERDKNPGPSVPQAPSVVSSWARAIVQALEARGLDGAALAERAGVPLEAIARADVRAPVSATGRLWRLAVEKTGDPAFGIFASRFLTFPTFHALGVAVLASASVKDAFHRLPPHPPLTPH